MRVEELCTVVLGVRLSPETGAIHTFASTDAGFEEMSVFFQKDEQERLRFVLICDKIIT